jgi:hypothetical protein
VGEVYCLFSTADGVPRYVGQTEETAQKRRRHHIARALDLEQGALPGWIRQVFASGHDVGMHVLLTALAPCDLDMFEDYWIGQFTDLLNVRRTVPPPDAPTAIGQQVIEGIQGRLVSAGNDPSGATVSVPTV